MDLEKLIDKVAENGKLEDMEELSEMLEHTMQIVKNYDEDCYKKYEMKLYKMAYGLHLNKSMAEEIVHNMRPSGMRWTYSEVEEMQRQRGLGDIDTPSFFTVINSAYNDYRDIFGEDIEMYIKFTLDFIEDEDAKDGKVFLYFTTLGK